MSLGNLNSGPDVCTESALPTEPSQDRKTRTHSPVKFTWCSEAILKVKCIPR